MTAREIAERNPDGWIFCVAHLEHGLGQRSAWLRVEQIGRTTIYYTVSICGTEATRITARKTEDEG